MNYTWPYLYSLIFQHKKTLIKANSIAVIATILSVPIPLFIPLLVDEVLLEKPAQLIDFANSIAPTTWHSATYYIVLFTVITVVLRLTSTGLIVWQTQLFTNIGKTITFSMRKQLLKHMQVVSISEYETLGSGTVSSRFIVDIETIDQFIGVTVSKFIISTLLLLGVTIVLLWLHWQLALFILLLNPVVILFTLKMGAYVKNLKKKENSAFEAFQQALTETLTAVQEVRAHNRDQHYFGQLTELAGKIRTHSSQFAWKSDAANKLSFLIFVMGFDLFRAIGMLMVLFSDLSIGEMLAVFSYLWFMMAPVQEVLNIQYAWYGAKAALKRINSLADLNKEPYFEAKQNPFTTTKPISIDAKNIRFGYKADVDILKNVTLHIKAGEKIALVGASGGGKSTFVQLLLGLYPPTQGDLRFNDVSYKEIGLPTIRDNIATVMQSPVMFNDSIRQNLLMGHQHSDKKLWNALEIAQLDEFIHGLPEKLDTLIGRQGTRLSGGQRQRLAIARMILQNPKIVILDEATSALDTATEENLHNALDNFLRNRTTLIIAHRLSAIKRADHIYVFENGHIIQQGNHEGLLKQEGLYKRLYD